MFEWLKRYYTRHDSRLNFWKEDLKLNLIGVGITLVFCAGCNWFSTGRTRKKRRNV